MEEKTFQPELVKDCLDQKTTLMTSLLDYTKEIEVQSSQEEPDLAQLISKRQQCMQRIDKCDALIKTQLELLGKEQKASWEALLYRGEDSGIEGAAQIKEKLAQYREMLMKTAQLDRAAVQAVEEKRTWLQEKVGNHGKSSMFR